jgi:hypothetical protein
VAVSRGKERVWIVSNPTDFATVCAHPEAKRMTVFKHMIHERGLDHARYKEKVPYDPAPIVPIKDLVQLKNREIPCVLTYAQVWEKYKSKDSSKKDQKRKKKNKK